MQELSIFFKVREKKKKKSKLILIKKKVKVGSDPNVQLIIEREGVKMTDELKKLALNDYLNKKERKCGRRRRKKIKIDMHFRNTGTRRFDKEHLRKHSRCVL